MKLVSATLIRCADRWSRISISDVERHQLRLLRAELGLDPDPTKITNNQTEDAAA